MAKIKCPKCPYEIETDGIVTVCPDCHTDLTKVMEEAGRVERKSRGSIVRDDSVTTHEFIVRTKGLKKIYKMGEVEVPALKGVDLDIRRASTSPSWAPPLGQVHPLQHGRWPGQAHRGHLLHRRSGHGPA